MISARLIQGVPHDERRRGCCLNATICIVGWRDYDLVLGLAEGFLLEFEEGRGSASTSSSLVVVRGRWDYMVMMVWQMVMDALALDGVYGGLGQCTLDFPLLLMLLLLLSRLHVLLLQLCLLLLVMLVADAALVGPVRVMVALVVVLHLLLH